MKGASVSFQLPYTCNAEHANHHRFGINRTVLTSDGKKLVSAGRDGCIKCWDITEAEPTILSSLEEHIDWVNDLLLIKDRTLISASSDNTIMMWDIEEHKHKLTFRFAFINDELIFLGHIQTM
jgi:WD40 repeat protein